MTLLDGNGCRVVADVTLPSVYIACPLRALDLAVKTRNYMLSSGWRISYDWTEVVAMNERELTRAAHLATRGVAAADVVLVLLPHGVTARGTWAELGIAIARERPVVIWSDDPRVHEGSCESTSFAFSPGVLKIVDYAEIPDACLALNTFDRGVEVPDPVARSIRLAAEEDQREADARIIARAARESTDLATRAELRRVLRSVRRQRRRNV